VVVNIADRAARDPDTVVTVDDLRAFERRHGRIPRDSAVLMDSGWAATGGDADAYRSADADGVLHFPGFGAEATEWLLRRRGIRALGADTLSIDPGVSETFDTHLILTGADRYGLENLNNLDRILRRGATIMVGLIPHEEGSGRPGPHLRLLVGPGQGPGRGPGRLDRLVDHGQQLGREGVQADLLAQAGAERLHGPGGVTAEPPEGLDHRHPAPLSRTVTLVGPSE
jgi:hypothetical protein